MRVGRLITERIRGQGRALGLKLGWFFQSRRRIATFVLVVAIIISSAGYGAMTLRNKNAFRAAEDDTTLPGWDYVEDTSMNLFQQGLDQFSANQLSDYDKVAITTDLAGLNYFRYNSVTERNQVLASWTPTNVSWKDFAVQADVSAREWLGWIPEECRSAPIGLKVQPRVGVSTALADDGDSCYNFEIRTKDIVTADQRLLEDYATQLHNLFGHVFAGTCKTTITDHWRRVLRKSCWSQADLDTLYTKFLPDLKGRRHAIFFTVEVDRLKSGIQLIEAVIIRPAQVWVNDYININLNLLMFAAPEFGLGKTVAALFKAGGKAGTAAFDVATHSPLGTTNAAVKYVVAKGAVQAINAAGRMFKVSSTLMGNLSVNLSSTFKKSTISTYGTQAERMITSLETSIDAFMGDGEFIAKVAGRPENQGLGIEVVKQQIAKKGEEIIYHFRVLNTREFSKTYKDGFVLPSGKLIVQDDGFFMANIGSAPGSKNFSNLPYSIYASDRAMSYYIKFTDSRVVLVRKLSEMNIYRQSDYLGLLTHGQLEKGAAEYNARYYAAKKQFSMGTLDFLPTKRELELDTYRAILDAGKRSSRGIDIESLHMDAMFRTGLLGYDPMLRRGLNAKALAILGGELEFNSPIYTVNSLLQDGRAKTAIKFLDALYR